MAAAPRPHGRGAITNACGRGVITNADKASHCWLPMMMMIIIVL